MRGLGPVEQAQVVASTSVVVSMATIVSAMAAIGQTPRLMDFISVLTVGLFGFTTVFFSLRYGRQLDAQRRHLLALNTISETVNRAVDLPVALESALSKMNGVLGTACGWIYMLKEGEPVLSCAQGTTSDFLALQGITPASFGAWAQEPRLCREPLGEAGGAIAPAVKAEGFQFVASVPLKVRETFAGALIVASRRLEANSAAQAELMQAFGNQISVALTNAHLFEQIRKSKAQYADLFENAPDIYLSVAVDHTILDCNATGARMLGATKDELVGRPCEEVFAAERRDAVRDLLERLLVRGEALRNSEQMMADRLGQTFPVYLNSSLVVDEQGTIVNARIVARDITERKKMEAAVLHAQKIESIGSLAGGIAHDFNNLLTAVQGSASIIRKNLGARSKLLKYADIIDSSARRGSALTRQLLTFARKTERQVSTVDINALLRGTIGLFRRNVPEGAEIELVLSEEAALVNGDEGQIQQALLNLLTNARDALPAQGGSIRATTEVVLVDAHSVSDFSSVRPGPFVLIRIADNGKGISPELQRRVFEPFFTTKDQGTGLGLSVVYGVVQSHGGFVGLESTPGCGTTVTVHLPRLAGGAAELSKQRKRLPRGSETILVIDTEVSIAEIARDMLTALGYTVYVEHDAAAGLEFYRARHDSIDLVLLDAAMAAGGEGGDTIAAFRAIRPSCLIAAISGGGPEAMEGSSPEGASVPEHVHTVLQKPFQQETLALTIRRVLEANARESA
ncbi:MAG TPA: ATP-binding protein [Bacteroidota bacterium]